MPHLYTPFNIKDWLDAKMPGANTAKIHVVAHCPTYDDSSKSNTISWKAETQGYYMNFEADVKWILNLPAVAFRPWRDSTGVGQLWFTTGATPGEGTEWTRVTDTTDAIEATQDPSENGNGFFHIYLRGEGIRQVTGSEAGACTGTFATPPEHARISGDLQTLLDWRQVAAGQRPEADDYAFAYMFKDWKDPDGHAFEKVIMGTLELPKYCYKGIYKNVEGLKSVAISKGQWLSEGCYESAFEDCTDLEEIPEEFNLTVPALAKRCYARLFYNCRSLKRVPENLLPAKVMADECYREMFWGCESLENTPDLNVTTLAEKCFKSMFEGCYKITSIPKYPLTDVAFAQGCFNGMFRDCRGLVDLREATCGTTGTTADACYQCMFQGCTGLKYPPKLISSGVDGKMMPLQYAQMFDGCTSLIALPEGDLLTGALKNTLAESCFKEMFRGCSSLTKLVPNMLRQYTVFPSHCCEMMFAECSKLKMSEIEQDRTYCIFNINADPQNIGASALADIFRDTGGRWTSTPLAKTNYYNYLAVNCIKFESSKQFALMLPGAQTTRVEARAEDTKDFGLYYCYDTSVASPVWIKWEYWKEGGSKLLDAHNIGTETEPHYVLYMKGSNIGRVISWGKSTAGTNQTGWTFRKSSTELVAPEAGIKVSGQMDCILDADRVEKGEVPIRLSNRSYNYGAFSSWFSERHATGETTIPSMLVDASELEPASSEGNTNVLYGGMFQGNSSLIHPPKVLPQEIVSAFEYQNMFQNCTSLTHTPEIKATSVAGAGCIGMFQGCTSLTQIADIWVTSFRWDDWGYQRQMMGMFRGCTALKTLPKLRARILRDNCYQEMFQNCTSLKLSDQPSADYPTPWKFPYIGTPGSIGSDAVKNMFQGVGEFPGGTNPGTPVPGKNYYLYKEPVTTAPWIVLYSTLPFTLASTKSWDGQLWYSGDSNDWTEWDGNSISAVESLDEKYYLYLRGTNNTYITGSSEEEFVIGGTTVPVYVKGCLENLLDYDKIEKGVHPTAAAAAFYNLFKGNAILNIATTDELTFFDTSIGTPVLTEGMFEEAFMGCGLTKLPKMTSVTSGSVSSKCFKNAFANCLGLTTASVPNIAVLGSEAYSGMFQGCTSLTSTGSLPATTLGDGAYMNMFRGCTALTTIGSFAATTFGTNACKSMFRGCTGFTTLNSISIGTAGAAGESCCEEMFMECTGLTDPPSLPMKVLAKACYKSMFEACTALTKIPNLPATEEYTADTITGCYYRMFYGCTGLTTLDGIPISLKNIRLGTCGAMFYGCTALKTAPKMDNVSAVGAGGCHTMFCGCTSLEVAPNLPATSVATQGYYGMFAGCTALKKIPALPATSLGEEAYMAMYLNCTNVKISTAKHDNYDTMFRIPTAGSLVTTETDIATGMFQGTSGDFTGTPLKETPYYADIGHTVADPNYVEFYAQEPFIFTPYPTNSKHWDGDMYYVAGNTPTESTTWTIWDSPFPTPFILPPIHSAKGDDGLYHLYIRGENNTKLTRGIVDRNYSFTDTARIYAYGKISKLLDFKATTFEPAESAFKAMFYGCANLVSGPTLDLTAPSASMYANMFQGCTSLAAAPVNKMTSTAESCCESMFESCTSLGVFFRAGQEKVFKPTDLKKNCYKNMFKGCTNFDDIDGNTFATGITSIGESCCEGMFEGCTALTGLAGFVLAGSCQFNGISNFKHMYKGCSALKDTSLAQFKSVLDGAALANSTDIAAYIFENCTGLTDAGKLFDSSFGITSLGTGCFKGMFKGCSNLVNAGYAIKGATDTNMANLAESCYEEMFYGCNSITDAAGWSALNPTDAKAAKYCFKSMFEGCSSISTAVTFTINELAEGCYQRMFYGCTNVTVPAVLSPTTLADYCYNEMYASSGVKLSTTPSGGYYAEYRIPNGTATGTEGTGSLTNMFANTAGIFVGTPAINTVYYYKGGSGQTLCFTAVTANSSVQLTQQGSNARDIWYSVNGSDWTQWTKESQPVITLTNVGDKVEFGGYNLSGLSTATNAEYFKFVMTGKIAASGNLTALINPLGTLTAIPCEGCFHKLFEGCSSLSSVPTLSSATPTAQCYEELFSGCTGLTTVPGDLLPATTLAARCYHSMFSGCTALTNAPALPATVMKDWCYYGMFYNCKALTAAPTLSSTELAERCYQSMFDGCTALATAPALPATVMKDYCYRDMFEACTSLTTPPTLPATTLAEGCYSYMFRGCSSLATTPTLSATSLKDFCYWGMFENCVSLASPCTLSAPIIPIFAYSRMFYGCSGIKMSETATSKYTVSYRIPTSATGQAGEDALTDMFTNTSGTFAGTPSINKTYYLWDVYQESLCFTANTAGSKIGMIKNGNPDSVKLQYSINRGSWMSYTPAKSGSHTMITLTNAGDKIYWRGYNPSGFSTDSYGFYTFMMEGSFAGSGSIMSLIDGVGETLSIPRSFCYYHLFWGCTSLTTPPALPATTLAPGCYMFMFHGCGNLTTAPALPATTLADECYNSMFLYCTSLTTPPALPATTMTYECYMSMFRNCTNLTTAPALPADTLADSCYYAMFEWCTSLTVPPELPATTLKPGCYHSMFASCESIKISTTRTPEYGIEYRIPTANWGTTAEYALQDMFAGCAGGPWKEGTPTINKTYYICGPTQNCLCFTANVANSTIEVTKNGNPAATDLWYNINRLGWNKYTLSDNAMVITLANVGDKIYWRGENPDGFNKDGGWYTFKMTGGLAGSGNVMSLIDGKGESTTIPCTYCFGNLFCIDNGTRNHLTAAPDLPAATALTEGCYFRMFRNCELSTGPSTLPAMTLTTSCYEQMFHGTLLTTPPTLPATTLAESCYEYMFCGCPLVKLPALPAQTPVKWCYMSMFQGCSTIKLNSVTIAEIQNAYRVPSTGSWPTPYVPSMQCTTSMFADCEGDVQAVYPNTTYYTNATVIYP